MSFLGKLISSPINILNVGVKATESIFDALCDEPIQPKRNALDDIADVIEDSVDKIIE